MKPYFKKVKLDQVLDGGPPEYHLELIGGTGTKGCVTGIDGTEYRPEELDGYDPDLCPL